MNDTEEIREQLIDIIATEGMIDRSKLTADATMESIGIASYDMVMILMAIEEKFGAYIPVEAELTDAKTLDALLATLTNKIQSQKAGAAEAGTTESTSPAPDTTTAAAAAAVTIGTPAAAAAMPAPAVEDSKSEAEAN